MTEIETKINNEDKKFCKDYIELRFEDFSKCIITNEGSILRIKNTCEIFDEPNNYICNFDEPNNYICN